LDCFDSGTIGIIYFSPSTAVGNTSAAVLNVQVAGPMFDGATATAAEQGHGDPSSLQHPHRQAVAHIKAHHHGGVLVVVEAAIGEHSINIRHDKSDQAHTRHQQAIPKPRALMEAAQAGHRCAYLTLC